MALYIWHSTYGTLLSMYSVICTVSLHIKDVKCSCTVALSVDTFQYTVALTSPFPPQHIPLKQFIEKYWIPADPRAYLHQVTALFISTERPLCEEH